MEYLNNPAILQAIILSLALTLIITYVSSSRKIKKVSKNNIRLNESIQAQGAKHRGEIDRLMDENELNEDIVEAFLNPEIINYSILRRLTRIDDLLRERDTTNDPQRIKKIDTLVEDHQDGFVNMIDLAGRMGIKVDEKTEKLFRILMRRSEAKHQDGKTLHPESLELTT